MMQHKPCRTCQPAGLILYRRNRQHVEPDTGQETSTSTRSTAPADTTSSTDSRQHQSARPRQSKDRQTASNAGQIPDAGHTGHTSNNITVHNVPPRLRDGRVTRHRAGHPHVSLVAGRAADRQGRRLRRLPWPCRAAARLASRPQAAFPSSFAARGAEDIPGAVTYPLAPYVSWSAARRT